MHLSNAWHQVGGGTEVIECLSSGHAASPLVLVCTHSVSLWKPVSRDTVGHVRVANCSLNEECKEKYGKFTSAVCRETEDFVEVAVLTTKREILIFCFERRPDVSGPSQVERQFFGLDNRTRNQWHVSLRAHWRFGNLRVVSVGGTQSRHVLWVGSECGRVVSVDWDSGSPRGRAKRISSTGKIEQLCVTSRLLCALSEQGQVYLCEVSAADRLTGEVTDVTTRLLSEHVGDQASEHQALSLCACGDTVGVVHRDTLITLTDDTCRRDCSTDVFADASTNGRIDLDSDRFVVNRLSVAETVTHVSVSPCATLLHTANRRSLVLTPSGRFVCALGDGGFGRFRLCHDKLIRVRDSRFSVTPVDIDDRTVVSPDDQTDRTVVSWRNRHVRVIRDERVATFRTLGTVTDARACGRLVWTVSRVDMRSKRPHRQQRQQQHHQYALSAHGISEAATCQCLWLQRLMLPCARVSLLVAPSLVLLVGHATDGDIDSDHADCAVNDDDRTIVLALQIDYGGTVADTTIQQTGDTCSTDTSTSTSLNGAFPPVSLSGPSPCETATLVASPVQVPPQVPQFRRAHLLRCHTLMQVETASASVKAQTVLYVLTRRHVLLCFVQCDSEWRHSVVASDVAAFRSVTCAARSARGDRYDTDVLVVHPRGHQNPLICIRTDDNTHVTLDTTDSVSSVSSRSRSDRFSRSDGDTDDCDQGDTYGRTNCDTCHWDRQHVFTTVLSATVTQARHGAARALLRGSSKPSLALVLNRLLRSIALTERHMLPLYAQVVFETDPLLAAAVLTRTARTLDARHWRLLFDASQGRSPRHFADMLLQVLRSTPLGDSARHECVRTLSEMLHILQRVYSHDVSLHFAYILLSIPETWQVPKLTSQLCLFVRQCFLRLQDIAEGVTRMPSPVSLLDSSDYDSS
ncbi:MAG: hypothetical protein MHM6MM_000234 [Cercozoa sp. M6MM]